MDSTSCQFSSIRIVQFLDSCLKFEPALLVQELSEFYSVQDLLSGVCMLRLGSVLHRSRPAGF